MSIPELPDAAAAGGDGRGGRVQARVGRAELIEGHEGVGEGADETSGDGARRAGNDWYGLCGNTIMSEVNYRRNGGN